MHKNQKNTATVLITGGAKRLGSEIALYLAQQGFSIALHYNHSKGEAESLAQEIRKFSVSCETFAADLTKEKDILSLIPKIQKKMNNLQVVINSASMFDQTTFLNSTSTNLKKNFAIHLEAPLTLTRQFAKLCKAGVIINILDTHISENKTSHFDYLLSKKSLANFTEMAAVQLAPQIRVNAIAPGLILAPLHKPAGYLQRLAQNIPLKRKGSPNDVAKAIHFLIKNDYITGQTIYVDGGEHLKAGASI